eukprot:2837591-Lingulodinium_polyedra.AAC.1
MTGCRRCGRVYRGPDRDRSARARCFCGCTVDERGLGPRRIGSARVAQRRHVRAGRQYSHQAL